jgi:regulator of nucleoside diphosphate kinase
MSEGASPAPMHSGVRVFAAMVGLKTSSGTGGTARLDTRADTRELGTMGTLPRIVLSRFDRKRLERLLDKVGPRPDLDALREEIERAEILEPENVPKNVVTMNSVVRFLDEESGRESEIKLVFPGHADVESNQVSVLAPVGSALLGLSVGDSIDWPLPNGRKRRLRVVAVTYQPEAAGDPI